MSDRLHLLRAERERRSRITQGHGDARQPIAMTQDGGQIFRLDDGSLSFTSPNMSTSNQDTIRELMRGATPVEAMATSPVAPQVDEGGRTVAALRSFLQGETFGFGDEMVAAGTSLAPGRTYDTELEHERSRLERGREEYPATALGSEIGGALVTGLATGVGPVAAQNTTLGRLGASSLTGAAEGGLYGFGAGEGGLEQRADNAGRGAIVGGIAGLATPIAMRTLSASLTPIRGAVNAVAGVANLGNQSRAVRAVARALENSGQSVDDVSSALRQAAADGQPMVVADALGIQGQRGLAGVARQPGPARTIAYDFLDQRQLDQSDRVGGFIRDAFGEQDTAALERARLATSRADDAAVNYGTARDSALPGDVSGAIGRIDDLLGRDPILGETTLSQGALGQRLQTFRNRLASDGEQLIDFDSVRNIRTDLREYIEANPRARSQFQGVYDDLTEALRQSSPDFQQANDAYRQASGVIDALDQGAQSASDNVRFADVQSRFRGLSPAEQDAFRTGMGDRLLARVERSSDGVNVARPFQSTRMREVVDELGENPEQMRRRLDREGVMFETRRQVIGGSQTADNLADQASVNGEDVGAIASLLQGNPGTAAAQVARRFVSGATGNNEATREAIARMLLSPDAAPVRQAADRTIDDQTRRLLVDALARRSAQMTAYGPAGVH